jgi:hypothetical protein
VYLSYVFIHRKTENIVGYEATPPEHTPVWISMGTGVNTTMLPPLDEKERKEQI